MTTVAAAVAAQIANAEVDRAFGLLGEGNLAIAVALEQQGRVTWTPMRREDAVVCAADGYAQGTGGCGVALVTHGPALTHTLTPLVGALKGSSPTVVITGEIDPAASHAPQYLDQRSLIESIGVSYLSAETTADAPLLVRRALSDARRDRRPVVVGIRTALQQQPLDARQASAFDDAHAEAADPLPAQERLDEVAALLARSERPVLLVGRGGIQARDDAIGLAERCGALLATTLLARGLFAGHPRDLGVCGGFSTRRTQQVIGSADLVIAFGASLNDYTTASGALFEKATVVQVDCNAEETSRRFDPDIQMHGDATHVAHRLRALLPPSTAGKWTRAPQAEEAEFEDESGDDGLDLRTVSTLLDHALPRPRAFVSDLGYFTSEPNKYIEIQAPDHQAFCLHFGSIGMGLATAIGLSAAHPDMPTLCAVGDGGLAASLGELETLARLALPVTVAVYNDSAYGVEWQALRHDGQATTLSEFPAVDFAGVANALGIAAMSATSTADFERVCDLLRDAKAGPRLIDFRLDRAVLTSWYRELVMGEKA